MTNQGGFPCFRAYAAAGSRARVKGFFHLLFSSVRGKVSLVLELGVALYFVSFGPSHQCQRPNDYQAPLTPRSLAHKE